MSQLIIGDVKHQTSTQSEKVKVGQSSVMKSSCNAECVSWRAAVRAGSRTLRVTDAPLRLRLSSTGPPPPPPPPPPLPSLLSASIKVSFTVRPLVSVRWDAICEAHHTVAHGLQLEQKTNGDWLKVFSADTLSHRPKRDSSPKNKNNHSLLILTTMPIERLSPQHTFRVSGVNSVSAEVNSFPDVIKNRNTPQHVSILLL